MIPTYVEKYGDKAGEELRIGWASWDDDEFQHRSIKYVYRDTSGKISRGFPELPFDVLVDMVIVALKQGELSTEAIEEIRQAIAKRQLNGSAQDRYKEFGEK